MKRNTCIIIVFMFLLTASLFSQSSRVDENASRFLARYVTSLLNKGNNSFPGDEANVVLQTRDGYMWFGGYNGLYRYDGSRFTVWDAVSPAGFGSSNIRALYEDAEGTLWIGTNDRGLVAYRNGAFKVYDKSAGLPSNTIRDIAEDKDGKIWCGTPEGLFYIDREEKIECIDSSAVVSLCFDRYDNLFIVLNDGGSYIYPGYNRNLQHWGTSLNHASRYQHSTIESVSHDRVIACTRRGEVIILRWNMSDGKLLREDVINTPLRVIESVYEDSNGYIWLIAENGIGYLDNTEVYRHVGDPSGAGFYRSMWEDYQNGYWIAATRGGITKLTVSAFTDLNALYQIDTGGVNAIVIDGDDIYIGTNDGLFAINKDGNNVHHKLTSMVAGRVRSITRDSRGNIWVCTYSNHGVIRYTPSSGSITYWTPREDLDSDRTRYAYELPDGVMVIATAVGLNFIKDDRVVTVNEALNTTAYIDLPDIMVLSLITSKDGTLYAGTDGSGVYAINKHGTVRYREEDGLTGGVVMRMHADPNENGIWVAASPGLCYINGDEQAVQVINKIPPYTFFDILQYNDELILLTSEVIINTNADDLLKEDIPFEFTSVGQSSGLNGQINANAWNVLSANGNLYLCTTTGCKYWVRENTAGNIVPYAGISRILIDGKEFTRFTDTINIQSNADRVTFELSFLSFGLLDDAVLRYNLLGYNNEPVTLTKNDSFDVSYTNLRGGSYTMQIWTEDTSGNTGNFIGINLYKEKHLFEYVFFWVVIALFLIAVTALIVSAVARFRLREATIRTKTEFVTIISHELRTPMNAINGMAEILLQSDIPQSAKEYAHDIKKAGNSLLALINDILDFSKIEAGKLEIIPVSYKLSSLLNETINIIRTRLMEKSILFFSDIDTEIPNNLIGDEIRIRQILLNLLSNAVKFTEQGSITLSVKKEKSGADNILLRIDVIDTGIGIKPEDQKKLFGEFVQVDTKSNRNIQGTGLGLSITKKLCLAMNGKVSVQSEYGKGSTFTVILPQTIDTNTASTETLADANFRSKRDGRGYTERSGGVRYIYPRSRILVVDDLPANLKVAEGLLAPYKTVVDVCESGADAAELVKYQKYDIIFMDHMMPDVDGIEATKRIRAWEKEQNDQGNTRERTPIIALTANAVSGMREMFIENGLDDLLSKPIDLFKLDQMLVNWIPDSKREANNNKEKAKQSQENLPVIPGIDVNKGVALTGGSVERYKQVLKTFCENAQERLPLLRALPAEENVEQLVLQAHTLKSALATIGAAELSQQAAELEEAGNDKKLNLFWEKLPVFMKDLTELLDRITIVL